MVTSRLASEQEMYVIIVTREHADVLRRLRSSERELSRYFDRFTQDGYPDAGEARLDWLRVFRQAASNADKDDVLSSRYSTDARGRRHRSRRLPAGIPTNARGRGRHNRARGDIAAVLSTIAALPHSPRYERLHRRPPGACVGRDPGLYRRMIRARIAPASVVAEQRRCRDCRLPYTAVARAAVGTSRVIDQADGWPPRIARAQPRGGAKARARTAAPVEGRSPRASPASRAGGDRRIRAAVVSAAPARSPAFALSA